MEIEIINENPLGTRASWHEYHMLGAIASSVRSSCLNVRSGSKIVNYKHETRATGYNGASGRIDKNCLETGCRKNGEYQETLDSGDCIGIHSEMNALGHLTKTDNEELFLYTTILPCPDCAKNIQPYNISHVIFKQFYSKNETKKSLDKLFQANIKVSQLNLTPERVMDLVFNEPERLTHPVWNTEESKNLEKYLMKD